MNKLLDLDEKMLLELLRAALNHLKVDENLFRTITSEDWEKCFSLAKFQGVSVLAWDGIVTLPKDLLPPQKIKLKWALLVDNYEKKYVSYINVITELREIFEKHGIKMVLLKGVGLSTYYFNPHHREGGDIDIYTCSMDELSMTNEVANELANQIIEGMNIEVDRSDRKNSSFLYKGICIENHKNFLETDAMKSAIKLDSYLKKNLKITKVLLKENTSCINIPSPEFNTVFLAYHAIQHYGNGLCLHHLCDWVCLLNKFGLVIPKEINDQHFLSIINVLTAITNRYLGTCVNVEYSDKLFTDILTEILRPKYPRKYTNKNSLEIILYKIQRFYHYLKLRKEVLGEPYYFGIRHSLTFHLRKPKAIWF